MAPADHTPARRTFLVFAAAMAVSAVALIGAAAMDSREVLGVPVWHKPLKFALSFVIMATTLAWMVDRATGRGRLVSGAAAAFVGAGVVEMLAIGVQAGRGVPSHFNISTPLDGAIFGAMGTAIIVLYVATLVLALAIGRSRRLTPDVRAALRWGLGISLVGMALGGLMLRPTPDQVQGFADGAAMVIGAHSVGVADGGPGLWFLGWSTVGGDLRIGHFVGMHALQAIPVAAWILARSGLAVATRVALIRAVSVGLLAVTLILTAQALAGESVIAPSGLTLVALASVVAGVGIASAIVVRRGAPGGAEPVDVPDAVDAPVGEVAS